MSEAVLWLGEIYRPPLDNTVVVLKPQNIVQAAEADLKRRLRNREGWGGDMEIYAFHRQHVARAKSAADLIERAIRGQERGLTSAKRQTRVIYGDMELLLAAKETALNGR